MEELALFEQLQKMTQTHRECTRVIAEATAAAQPVTPESVLQMHATVVPQLIKANEALLIGVSILYEYLLES